MPDGGLAAGDAVLVAKALPDAARGVPLLAPALLVLVEVPLDDRPYASSIFSLGSFTGICGERSGAASFAYTVLRETPTFRAISEMDSPLLRSWRIE